jgi:hypothetical protein
MRTGHGFFSISFKKKFLMAFTRFHDDPFRVQKWLQETTDVGLYYLNTPGNGDAPAFVEDPHVRLQGWGANRAVNHISVENHLRGLDQRLSKAPTQKTMVAEKRSYPFQKIEVTTETRMEMPAWTLRDAESKMQPLYDAFPVIYGVAGQNSRLAAKDSFGKKSSRS